MHQITYRFEEADLVDARLHAYTALPLVRLVRLIPYALIAFGVLLAAGPVLQGRWADAATATGGWFLFGFGLLLWTFAGDRWLLPRSVRKSLAKDNDLRSEFVVSWDADGVGFQSAYGRSRWPWADLARWQESPGGLLLWQNSRLYNYIPKRVLGDDQVSDLRAHLTAALATRGKGGK